MPRGSERRKLLRDSKLNKKRSPECIHNIKLSLSKGKVYLYTIDKSLLFIFISAKELYRILGSGNSFVSKVLESYPPIFRGYWLLSSSPLQPNDSPLFSDSSSPDFINLVSEVIRCKRIEKLIYVYNKDFLLLHRFEYIKEARKVLGIHDSTIRKYLNSNKLFNSLYFSNVPLAKS